MNADSVTGAEAQATDVLAHDHDLALVPAPAIMTVAKTMGFALEARASSTASAPSRAALTNGTAALTGVIVLVIVAPIVDMIMIAVTMITIISAASLKVTDRLSSREGVARETIRVLELSPIRCVQ